MNIYEFKEMFSMDSKCGKGKCISEEDALFLMY